MNTIKVIDQLPDIHRYIQTQWSKKKVLLGFLTIQLLCWSIWSFYKGMTFPFGIGTIMIKSFIGLQIMIFVGYAFMQVSLALLRERAEGTWDFLRLTPLSSFQIISGKLIGPSLYPLFLAIMISPWLIMAVIQSDGSTQHMAWKIMIRMASGALLALSYALLYSSYATSKKDGKKDGTSSAGTFLICSMVFLVAQLIWVSGDETIKFYHRSVPSTLFWSITNLSFATWFFLGAKWRVGSDLLEPRRIWRFPGFLFFLAFFVTGLTFDKVEHHSSMIALGVIVYLSAFINSERQDYWRDWLYYRTGWLRVHNTPIWIIGCASILITCGFFALWRPISTDQVVVSSFYLIPLFICRDLMFLQICRLSKLKSPEVMALVYIILAYVIPLLLLKTSDLFDYLYFFSSIGDFSETSPIKQIAPVTVQLGFLATILFRQIQDQQKRASR